MKRLIRDRSKTCPISSHQTQQVQEKPTYHYRIRLHEIGRILLISRAKPGLDPSQCTQVIIRVHTRKHGALKILFFCTYTTLIIKIALNNPPTLSPELLTDLCKGQFLVLAVRLISYTWF